MKKFRFRLQRLLEIKEHVEKEKQKVLALATRKVYSQEEYLRRLNLERRENQEEQRQFLTGSLNSSQLLGYSRYFLKLKSKELAGIEVLKVYRTEQEKKRLELLEAAREKKTFEKLKERKRDAHFKEAERLLQKEQDELAAQMMRHKKSSHR